ncbi:hypothetical protein [Pseudodesulfovibrio karagichevae]|uniref:Uncharacterized protein n=1 Tax=Pseudodesulfovibrio karagichevae TaxID=3239305 RepID=A0ABV4K5H1_9BACT
MTGLTLRNTSEYILVAPDRDLRTVIGGSDERWPGVVVPNANLSLEVGGQEVAWLNINRTDATAAAGETFDGETLATPSGDIFRVVDDRLKWDVAFTEHPGAYAWAFGLTDSGNLSYHYQPALTWDEIMAGHERPDDVVGSYAVYMDRMHGPYGTGKFIHVYRPWFQDANGNGQWGTIDITNGVMTISIDPAWLDAAVYPVTLDPTIGYSTMGASVVAASSAYRANLAADMYTAVSGDTVKAIHAGFRTYSSGSLNVGIFDAADNSRVANESVYVGNSSYVFRSVTGLSISLTDAHEYFMGAGINTAVMYIYDSYTNGAFRGTYADPWVDIKVASYRLSMYADIESGGGSPVNFDEALSVSGGGSASLTARLGYPAALSATGGGAAELAALVGFLDSLSASGGGGAALADRVGFQAGLAVSGGGSASLTARIGFKDVLSISGGGAAELAAVVEFYEALAVSGGGSATIFIEGDTAVIREVIRLAGNRRLNFQLAGQRRLVITLTGNIGD